MKKLISLILALALVPAAIPVLAEETETDNVYQNVLEWGPTAAQIEAAGIQGTYYTLNGVHVAFWVPEYLTPKDPEGTYEETGMLAAFSSESGDMGFIISLFDMPAESMDQYAEEVDKAGAEEGRRRLINGLDTYTYVYDGTMIAAILVKGGGVLVFSFYTATDERFFKDASIIAASIQPYDPPQEE